MWYNTTLIMLRGARWNCFTIYDTDSQGYFKESLQLQRTEKFQTSKHFKISCQKQFFISPNFFSYFLQFLCFSLPNAASTTAQANILHRSFSKCHAFQHSFLHFSTVPIQNLQLQLPNSHFTTAQIHFTTAQIVISCTLKYALGSQQVEGESQKTSRMAT